MKFFTKRSIQREDNKDYLIRWNFFECRFFSIKLHRILLSDYACQHDHPWAFLSIILWGGYVEYTADGKSKIYHPGNILYRKAQHIHRLEIHQPATTLVITFKKVRMWGFWTKAGFVPFYQYRNKNHCE